MNELVQALNDNSGAIVAATATVSAVLTVLLLFESRATRNLRREAAVEARAKCHPPASFLLELDVKNFGPANARALVIEHYLANPDGTPVCEKRRQAETLVGPGEGRRFLPMMANNSSMLNEMAQANLTLHVAWSWTDDRRRLWFFPLRHSEKRSWATTDLARDFFGGWALTERDSAEDIHEIAEKLRKIEGHQKSGRQTMEKGVSAFIRAVDGRNRQSLTTATQTRLSEPTSPEPDATRDGRVRRFTTGLRRLIVDILTGR